MSLLSTFEAFLRQPAASALAESATISYVPTLTTIDEPTAILRHLQAQQKQLTKKSELVLDAIEGANGLHVEMETTLEFVLGGGAYLPGLDDNFLADKSYVVHFDASRKITNVRVAWDQGSLLKQLEVIGARGRNWPIRDGKDQIRLIASQSSMPRKEVEPAGLSTRRSTTSSGHSALSTSATGDPHASLNLFAPRQIEEETYKPDGGEVVSTRTSMKPPARNLEDILTGNYDPVSPNSAASGAGSPSKNGNGAEKSYARIGASKHFQPMRLFDENAESEETPRAVSPSKSSKKYSHFELGEGEDVPVIPASKLKQELDKKSKHASQWGLEDFVTPDVRAAKVARQNERTYDWDAEAEEEGQASPTFRPVVHRARPDAQTHFDLAKETPFAERKQTVFTNKGRQHNDGLGLYKDHILGDDDADDDSLVKKPLASAINIHNARRSKDFAAHWDATDKPPSAANAGADGPGKENGGAPLAGKKPPKSMNPSWGAYGESPGADQAQKENVGIKTAGNGMGGRNTVRNWGFGFDNEGEDDDGDGGDAAAGGAKEVGAPPAAEKSFWDF